MCVKNKRNKEFISLWDLLAEYKEVQVPIIQRDYAQGRKDPKTSKKRKGFLYGIYNALINDEQKKFEFVYGNTGGDDNKTFYPLDGQQRITTLWLLHWYLAFKGDKLDSNEVKETLSKFTYQTRSSARKFCEALCTKELKYGDANEGFIKAQNTCSAYTIADYIKDQTWFMSEWMLDPTIDAMLRTVSGSKENGKNGGKTSDDNLESIFSDSNNFNKNICKELIENLTGEISTGKDSLKNLVFKKIIINKDELPVADDLYIKMNSRGKQLTAFEDFKNNIDDWMEKKNITKRSDIIKSIDTVWTDVVWTMLKDSDEFTDSKKGDLFEKYLKYNFNGRLDDSDKEKYSFPDTFIIDDSLYAFVNRYIITDLMLRKEQNKRNQIEYIPADAFKDEKLKNAVDGRLKAFRILLDNLVENYRFEDAYEPALAESIFENIDIIFRNLSQVNDLDTTIKSELRKNKLGDRVFYLIPYKKEIDKNNKVVIESVENSLPNLFYFYIITHFILHLNMNKDCKKESNIENVYVLNDTGKEKLKRFIRVARNIGENSNISDTRPNCINAIRWFADYFEDYSKDGSDIYEYVKNRKPSDSDSYLKRQLIEEAEKIERIDDLIKNSITYDEIIAAENYAFFDGSIRFLYRDDKGNPDWNGFKEKWNNCSGNGVNQPLFNNDGKVPLSTLEKLLRKFKDFKELRDTFYDDVNNKPIEINLFTLTGSDPRIPAWKERIFWDESICCKINGLFMNPDKDEVSEEIIKNPVNELAKAYNEFLKANDNQSNERLIESISENNKNKFILKSEMNNNGNIKSMYLFESCKGKYHDCIPIIRNSKSYEDTKRINNDFYELCQKKPGIEIREGNYKKYGDWFLCNSKVVFYFTDQQGNRIMDPNNPKYSKFGFGWCADGSVIINKKSDGDGEKKADSLAGFIRNMNI